MSYKTIAKLLRGLGIGIDVLAPMIATLTQLPVWIDRSEGATVSGVFIIMAFFCVIPFWRQVKDYMKNPSAPVMWAIFAAVFLCVREICDEMIMISLVGLAANGAGSGLLIAAKKMELRVKE